MMATVQGRTTAREGVGGHLAEQRGEEAAHAVAQLGAEAAHDELGPVRRGPSVALRRRPPPPSGDHSQELPPPPLMLPSLRAPLAPRFCIDRNRSDRLRRRMSMGFPEGWGGKGEGGQEWKGGRGGGAP